MRKAPWTLDELSERVDAALSVDYDGQPSGRVRVVPDRRSIRWYTTIGLVDRPAAHRGRTAMYGHRHLLQLVAIKRLQARGLPLVAIQAELAGATDAQLAGVARLPAAAPAPKPVIAPTPAPPIASLDAVPAAPASGAEAAVPAAARRARFWRERPVLATFATTEPATRDEPDPPALDVATMRGLRLSRRATLLLDPARPLDAGDLRAILDAARPLLDALRARGLDGSDPGREHP